VARAFSTGSSVQRWEQDSNILEGVWLLMARLLVLSFDPDKEAVDFIEYWFKHKDEEGFAKFQTPDGRTVEAEVVGLYAQPTKFCTSAGYHKASGRNKISFVKGNRFGWWICTVCSKPSTGWGQSVSAVIGSGRDLFMELRYALNHPKEGVTDETDETQSAEAAEVHRAEPVPETSGTDA
jgi:hypothetical protein